MAEPITDHATEIRRLWALDWTVRDIAEHLDCERTEVMDVVAALHPARPAADFVVALDKPRPRRALGIVRRITRPAPAVSLPGAAVLRTRTDRVDLDRQAAIGDAREQLTRLVVELRTYARVPTDQVRAALGELGPLDRITVAQLAVAVHECGGRLVVDWERTP